MATQHLSLSCQIERRAKIERISHNLAGVMAQFNQPALIADYRAMQCV